MCASHIVSQGVQLRALQDPVKHHWPSEIESEVSHHLWIQFELFSVMAVLLVYGVEREKVLTTHS